MINHLILTLALSLTLLSCASNTQKNNLLFQKYRSPSSIDEEQNIVFKQAHDYCKKSNLNFGINLLSNVYSQEKNNPEYWNTYFLCYYKENMLTKAEYFINKAILLSSNDKYKNNLSLIYIKSNNYLLAYNYLKPIAAKSKSKSLKLNFMKLSLILNKANIIHDLPSSLENDLASILFQIRDNNYKAAYVQMLKIKDVVSQEKILVPLFVYLSIKTNNTDQLLKFAEANKIDLNEYSNLDIGDNDDV